MKLISKKESDRKYYLKNKEKIKNNVKKWCENNKEHVAKRHREYFQQHKQEIVEKNKMYREKNKDSIFQIHKSYRKKHKDKIKNYMTDYYKKHKEKLINRAKLHYEKNAEEIREKVNLQRANNRERAREIRNRCKPTTPEQKLIKSMRGRMYDIFSRGQIIKTKKTLELLGCSQTFLKHYIQKQFTKGMSWKNYGKWHIDHIIPIDYFVKKCNFSLTKTQKKCFNYNNLQPMWAIDNLQKGSKLI